ncbi:hypothetical protein [Microbulbifer sp. SA54]|uniref:hypothetical protein n=1 Tax=Microbulbifer sp. SA54 TaxID=3401577 RepID=UPI003AACAFEC
MGLQDQSKLPFILGIGHASKCLIRKIAQGHHQHPEENTYQNHPKPVWLSTVFCEGLAQQLARYLKYYFSRSSEDNFKDEATKHSKKTTNYFFHENTLDTQDA